MTTCGWCTLLPPRIGMYRILLLRDTSHCSVRTKCLPHDCPVGEWIVDCEDAQPQPAVTVTVVPGVVKPQVVGGGGGDLSDLSPSPSHVAVGEATHRNGKGSS